MEHKSTVVGLIGCGKMGSAVALSLLRRDPSVVLRVYDADRAAMERLQDASLSVSAGAGGAANVDACEHLPDVLHGADTVFIAVKPHLMVPVLEMAAPCPPTLLVSVAAGVELAAMRRAAPRQRIIRAMPNAPALVGAGVTVVLADQESSPEDVSTACAMLEALGEVVIVRAEKLMHAVTGLSGSGPAYVALIVEALADGAVAEGLPRALAYQLARATLRGTVALLEEVHPALVKDSVTSPGGTTAAALRVLERAGLRSALIEAVAASSAKSRELAK